MARFNYKKARKDVAQTGGKNERFALMQSHQGAINDALRAHLDTDPAEPFDVVVAHRGDLVGVKFHEAMAEQSGRAVAGDVGIFIVTRESLLAQLDTANPDVAANLRDVHPMKPTVVCFAFQGTTAYIPSDSTAGGNRGGVS